MTIDMHCHLFVEEFTSDNEVPPFWVPGDHASGRSDEEAEAARRRVAARPKGYDPEGTNHIRRMDDAGIERSVILHLDKGLLFGEPKLSIEQQNEYVSKIARRHSSRFSWFCGIDPRRDRAVDLLEKCVTEWGAKGVKMYPTTGFLPADKVCYPFYERAAAWKIPVLFHMGPENPPFYNQGNAHAAVLLRVLVDFPDLTVIVAHLGFEFWRDLIALGKVRDNVMCDFCAWQTIADRSYDQFCHILRKFLDEFGTERIMFGTDAPLIESTMTSKRWVELVASLPRQSSSSKRFTEAEVNALLDENARRLLDSIPV